MDTFVEQIVKKKKTVMDWLIIVAIILAAFLLSSVIFLYVRFLVPMIVLVVWGAWWLCTNRNIEFEYSITNGEMDIDMIIAQRRRKRLCSIKCAKVEAYGPVETADLGNRKFDHTVMAAPSVDGEGNYYFVYRSKKYGSTLVLFQPEERVQNAFFAALPRLMQIELEKKLREL